MTKQHFIAMAEMINLIRRGEWTNDFPAWAGVRFNDIEIDSSLGNIDANYTRAVWTAEFCILLASQVNPRFDTDRFLIACGLLEAPKKAKRR